MIPDRLGRCAALICAAALANASDWSWLPTPSLARWDAGHGCLPDWGWGWSGWERGVCASAWSSVCGSGWSPGCGSSWSFGRSRVEPPACGYGDPWWRTCPPVVIDAGPHEDPTAIAHQSGGYEQVGDTGIPVPDPDTPVPAGITDRSGRHRGGVGSEAPDGRQRSLDR